MINRIYNTFVFLIIIGLCFYSCNDDEKQKEKYYLAYLYDSLQPSNHKHMCSGKKEASGGEENIRGF